MKTTYFYHFSGLIVVTFDSSGGAVVLRGDDTYLAGAVLDSFDTTGMAEIRKEDAIAILNKDD